MKGILDFLNDNDGLSVIIASISALISAITVSVAIYFNIKTQKQYREGQKPLLSMRVDNYNNMLYLFIQNTGKAAAKDIKITVKSIEHNGETNELMLDALFKQSFELYPQETTQGMVALWGGSISGPAIFPSVLIDVQYKIAGNKKPVSYSRKVTFSKYYDTKVYADVNMNLKQIEDSLDTTTRAAVRVANYLDGCQVAPFDKLNILAETSLHNDLCSAMKSSNIKAVKDRSAAIKSTLNRKIDNRTKAKRNTGSESVVNEDESPNR